MSSEPFGLSGIFFHDTHTGSGPSEHQRHNLRLGIRALVSSGATLLHLSKHDPLYKVYRRLLYQPIMLCTARTPFKRLISKPRRQAIATAQGHDNPEPCGIGVAAHYLTHTERVLLLSANVARIRRVEMVFLIL